MIKEKHDAARLSIRARKATKIARAWLARRSRLEPEKDPLAAMHAERLNEYDEQLKSKDTKEGQVCLFCNDMWRRATSGPFTGARRQTTPRTTARSSSTWLACPSRAGAHATEGGGDDGRADAERKEALAKLVVPLQVSRLKVLQAMNDIEVSKVWGKWKKLDDARTTCDFAVADAERADAELQEGRVWDGGRRDARARGGGGGDRG